MMETAHQRGTRYIKANGTSRKPHSRNKHWVAEHVSSNENVHDPTQERWTRGGHRGGRGRNDGRKSQNRSVVFRTGSVKSEEESGGEGTTDAEEEEDDELQAPEEPVLETAEEREKFYQELVKAREAERKRAIAEGKMDDPLVPKRLDEAITMVGTCMDMCPRFERYRRERENNLDKWETIPGTRRVDHKRAVKAYERAAGDKTIPSDLRPPRVLKKTLDYLFHKLLPEGGFENTHTFIRDRSRAARTDFTMQHETGPLAIECHDRCARYHILALHFMREKPDFSIALEEQQLMNTLQSLKEFYEDQRQRYQSPTELEMRVYHRLIHIRDQRERHDDIPAEIRNHPVFKLTTQFRLIVQAKSSPITKTSALVVDAEAMEIFGQLAAVLRDSGSVVMIYLVACILERLFGKDTIEDIEAIRGDLSIPDIIDGISDRQGSVSTEATSAIEDVQETPAAENVDSSLQSDPSQNQAPSSVSIFGSSPSSAFGQPSQPSPFTTASASPTPAPPPVPSAFANLKPTPNAFVNTPSVFGSSSAFGSSSSVFGSQSTSSGSLFGPSKPTGTTATVPAPASVFTATSQSLGPSPNRFGASSSAHQANMFGTQSPGNTSALSPPSDTSAVSAHTPTPTINGFGSSATTPSWPAASTTPSAPTSAPSPSLFSSDQSSQPISQLSFEAPKPQPPKSSTLFGTTSLNPAAPAFTPFKLSKEPNVETSSAQVQSTTPSTPAKSREAKSSSPRPSLSVSTNVNGTSASPGSQPEGARRPSIFSYDIAGPRTPLSEPPTPVKVQPVSLPSTPTASMESIPRQARSLKGFPSISTEVPSANGSLSPIFGSPMKSPTKPGSLLSMPELSTEPGPSISKGPSKFPGPPGETAEKPSSKSAKGKERETYDEQDDARENGTDQGKAMAHRDMVVLRSAFKRWYRVTTNPFLGYKPSGKKAKRELQALPPSRAPSEESTVSTSSVSSRAWRKRNRPSMPSEIMWTDEDVARRLRENREEHESRWTQGSFLASVRAVVHRKAQGDPPFWNLWLSMNPDVDGTAIWVQRKFSVPESGEWLSENSFQIPISSQEDTTQPPSAPSLLVFECSPIADIGDDVERKYRAVDDYGRLRQVVKSFPKARRYSTSVVFIIWAEEEQKGLYKDLFEMIEDLMRDQLFADYRPMIIGSETKDLDGKFSEILDGMSLDVTARHSTWCKPDDLLAPFLQRWKNLSQDWAERCFINGEFDYELFGQAVHKLIDLMTSIFKHLAGLTNRPSLSLEIPAFGHAKESDALYEQTTTWLKNDIWKGTTDSAIADLEAYRYSRLAFPVQVLLEDLGAVIPALLRAHLPLDLTWPLPIPNVQLQSALKNFETVTGSAGGEFDELLVRRPLNPSPSKRRMTEDHLDTISGSTSGKRMKMSSLTASRDPITVNGTRVNGRHDSPSPSSKTSSSAGDGAVVTLAMLRARTREVREKYGHIP